MGLGMRLKSKKICPGSSAELGTSIPLLRQADRPAFQLVEDSKAEFHSGIGTLMWVGDQRSKENVNKRLFILWMKKLPGPLNYCLSFFSVTNEVVWFLFIKKITTHTHKKSEI